MMYQPKNEQQQDVSSTTGEPVKYEHTLSNRPKQFSNFRAITAALLLGGADHSLAAELAVNDSANQSPSAPPTSTLQVSASPQIAPVYTAPSPVLALPLAATESATPAVSAQKSPPATIAAPATESKFSLGQLLSVSTLASIGGFILSKIGERISEHGGKWLMGLWNRRQETADLKANVAYDYVNCVSITLGDDGKLGIQELAEGQVKDFWIFNDEAQAQVVEAAKLATSGNHLLALKKETSAPIFWRLVDKAEEFFSAHTHAVSLERNDFFEIPVVFGLACEPSSSARNIQVLVVGAEVLMALKENMNCFDACKSSSSIPAEMAQLRGCQPGQDQQWREWIAGRLDTLKQMAEMFEPQWLDPNRLPRNHFEQREAWTTRESEKDTSREVHILIRGKKFAVESRGELQSKLEKWQAQSTSKDPIIRVIGKTLLGYQSDHVRNMASLNSAAADSETESLPIQ